MTCSAPDKFISCSNKIRVFLPFLYLLKYIYFNFLFHIKIIISSDLYIFRRSEQQNLANRLTSLALNLTKTNKERHQAIQDFFITNDSTTIATEVPVYLTNDDLLYFNSRNFSINPKDFKTPVTGHIDILQIRNNLIHILDYKPEASKENPIRQLAIYALALASKTKLPLTMFKCAWFDENNYFEFFPLHVV